jgi:hypothetical protein
VRSARDSLLDGAQLVSGSPLPTCSTFCCLGTMATLPSGGKKLLATGTYSQHRNLVETFCTWDTQKSFIKETKSSDARCKATLFSSYCLYLSFRGECCSLPCKKIKDENILCFTYLIFLIMICKFVHYCPSFVFICIVDETLIIDDLNLLHSMQSI